MAAELGRRLVGAEHHRQRVPAHRRAQLVLNGAVARMRRFLSRSNRVDVRRVRRERQLGAAGAGDVDCLAEQVVGAIDAIVGDY